MAEDGPWNLVARLRAHAGDGFLGKLMDCFNCSSLWLAAPFAIAAGSGWLERILLWPALSGGAILLERVTVSSAQAAVAQYSEEGREDDDVMLRK